MRLRPLAIVALCGAAALLFARLGVWQLHRLAERRAANARIAERLAAPPMPVKELPRDTASAHYRRVTVRGTFDFAHELWLTGRSHEGSPGVWLLTPVRLPGSGTAVLVNRGWVYSPDGASLDPTRWREEPAASFSGFVEELPRSRGGTVQSSAARGAVRRLDATDLARRIPYPIFPFYVVRTDSAPPRADAPATLRPPPLDEGPHRSYAVQWFAFAVIALVGAAMLVRAELALTRK
jgi:surfeit locus 1 family protein